MNRADDDADDDEILVLFSGCDISRMTTFEPYQHIQCAKLCIFVISNCKFVDASATILTHRGFINMMFNECN